MRFTNYGKEKWDKEKTKKKNQINEKHQADSRHSSASDLLIIFYHFYT